MCTKYILIVYINLMKTETKTFTIRLGADDARKFENLIETYREVEKKVFKELSPKGVAIARMEVKSRNYAPSAADVLRLMMWHIERLDN